MPSFNVYGSKTSFNIQSSWTTPGNASVGSETISFVISDIPDGATNITTTVCATYDRSSPYGGTASGYPTANGISFSYYSSSQYRAVLTFSDLLNAKVTFKYKSNGVTGHTQGSLQFTNVYILVEYDLPSTEWSQNSTTVSPGSILSGTVNVTEDNADYIHYIYIDYSGDTGTTPPYTRFTPESVQTQSFSISIPSSWANSVASYENGIVAYVYHQLEDTYGNIVSKSDAKAITLITASTVAPVAGYLYCIRSNLYNDLFIQNYSTVSLRLSGYSGDEYGSTQTSIRIVSSTGTSVTFSASSSSISWVYGIVKTSGYVTFTATVTDSRGNQASTSCSLYVNAYSPPSISSARVGRYDPSTNTIDASKGEGAYAVVNYTYTDLGTNVPTLSVDYRSTSVQGVNSYYSYPSAAEFQFASSGVTQQEVFDITLTISDGISSTSVQRKLGTAEVFIRQDPKNNAIGFGCYPTIPSASSDKLGCFEVAANWDFRVGGESILDLISNASTSNIVISTTEPANPEPGTIWLDIS